MSEQGQKHFVFSLEQQIQILEDSGLPRWLILERLRQMETGEPVEIELDIDPSIETGEWGLK